MALKAALAKARPIIFHVMEAVNDLPMAVGVIPVAPQEVPSAAPRMAVSTQVSVGQIANEIKHISFNGLQYRPLKEIPLTASIKDIPQVIFYSSRHTTDFST